MVVALLLPLLLPPLQPLDRWPEWRRKGENSRPRNSLALWPLNSRRNFIYLLLDAGQVAAAVSGQPLARRFIWAAFTLEARAD